jgi:osmotically-inducible protein OsmY
MKIKNPLVLLVLIASPIALFASAEIDRQIEDAAKTSYNFRTVLDNQVSVRANGGVVRLDGIVKDKDFKALAEDTVSSLPGVTSVDNQMILDPTLPEHSDDWIAFKVHTQLLVSSKVSAEHTKVMVRDGVVTLTGTADNSAQKELTEKYAKEIDGVKSVENNIVAGTTPNPAGTMREIIDDASVTAQLKYVLMMHRATSALKLKITTKAGVVAVKGEAGSDAEKSLVGKIAEGIRGVKSVTNNITVKN